MIPSFKKQLRIVKNCQNRWGNDEVKIFEKTIILVCESLLLQDEGSKKLKLYSMLK